MDKVPLEIRLRKKSRLLTISFENGQNFDLPFEYLRVSSPSAEVRGHGTGEGTLQVNKQNVEIDEIDVFPLAEGEYYQFELMGLKVLSSDGDLLGTITEIISTGSNDVFVVHKDDREILVPDLQHVVEQVDLENNTMIVQLLPGLV